MENTRKIIVGSDHAGFELKKTVLAHLKERGFDCTDVGTDSADSCHYPVFAHKLCEKIQNGEAPLGILVCGTGIGMSMAANKHKGIRAAACSDVFSAKYTRLHNDANVLCIGDRVLGAGLALELVDVFVDTEFEGGKHLTRIEMFKEFENA